MKISKGDKLEEITLPRDDGSTFNLSETHGKKVLLTFYRIAGCLSLIHISEPTRPY